MDLYVNESGPDAAESIVFLHGGGGGGWMWQPQVKELPDFHCLVPDLPEHGRSMGVKPFSIANSAEQVAELICKHAHGGKAHVVGLSEGAQVALALLGSAPEVVERAIISSALVRPIPGANWMSPGMIAWSVKWSVEPFKNSDWWIRINMKYSAGVPDAYYPQFKADFQDISEEQFTHIIIENQRFRLPDGLGQVQVPTLVVAGKKEYGAMRQSVKDIEAALPKAKGFLVAHKKHFSLAQEHNWNMNTPELFNRMLRAWITDQSLPTELEAV